MTYKCQNCGAPIEGVICPYCHTRNAIDLKLSFPVYENPDRICPNCSIPLQTHLVDERAKLYIETCPKCKGLFLDFGELEAILEREITPSERHNLKLLEEIKNNPLSREREIRYKKCPQCQKVMLRLNYRARSGVIIDRCVDHGYWLDAGELRQIMEWIKLEGERDFTPTLSKELNMPKTRSKSSSGTACRFGNSTHSHSFDPIVGILRKLYGF